MKVLIDINKNDLKRIKASTNKTSSDYIILNGTPLPDNATNGGMLEAMFPDAEIHLDGNDVFFHHMGFWIKFNIRWWNASYQKVGKE